MDILLDIPMPVPTAEQIKKRFAVGIYLDHLWCQTMRLPIDDKESVLITVLEILHEHRTPYSVIGGIAVQLYTREPRTTQDIDIAVGELSVLPREDLISRGFKFTGLYDYTENWLSPAPPGTPKDERIPVQFSCCNGNPEGVPKPSHDDSPRAKLGGFSRDGSPMTSAVSRSFAVDVGFPLQLVTLPDLVELKLQAVESPHRQRSKRVQDVADVMKLVEEHPEVGTEEVEHRMMAGLAGKISR